MLIAKKRLVSLDALRGFDMFWIICGASLAKGFACLDCSWGRVVAQQFSHSEWNGFTFYDLIFPMFIYITGISAFLSLKNRLDCSNRKGLVKHVLKRAAILFVLGIIYNHGPSLSFSLADIRIMGVLQRIALCYLGASLMVIYTRPKTQIITALGILICYWAVMRFVPVPGFGAGFWTEQGNLAGYLDRLLLPGHLYHESWDPEGPLTTIPAFATGLLGVLTGYWLKATNWHQGKALSANDHSLYLFVGGTVLAVSG
ncbi:MAG: acyltransferase family protein, partial [Chitinophagales bacterium]